MAQLALKELEERILLRSDLRQDQVIEAGLDILSYRFRCGSGEGPRLTSSAGVAHVAHFGGGGFSLGLGIAHVGGFGGHDRGGGGFGGGGHR